VSRGFPTNVANALATSYVSMVTFAKLEFPNGTVYLHNSIGTFTWGGNDWLGVGDLGTISEIEEGIDVSPYKLTLALSGLDAAISGAALTQDYYNQPVTVYLGVLDANDVLLADPTIVWQGVMDQMDLSVGAESGDVIQLTCESELARFDKASNRKYTDSQQQNDFASDVAFEFMAQIEGAKIRWGDANSQNITGISNTPAIGPINPGNIYH
jgi:hypothetical protein